MRGFIAGAACLQIEKGRPAGQSNLRPAGRRDDHLAAQGCKRVYVDGGKTIQSFIRRGLIDELVITRIPVLIGQGIPLFGGLEGDVTWEHTGTQILGKGMVKSGYRRVVAL